jgi:hypothetical protein
VANLLVLMEFNRGALLPVSLEALGQARRLGSAIGLSVYALVPLPSEPAKGDSDITARCGRFGADKVLLLTGDRLFSEQEMRYENYAEAVMAACAMVPPRLLFVGDTPAARDLAPRLASRLGAAYLPAGTAFAEDGTLQICDQQGRHLDLSIELDVTEDQPPMTIPVVITVPAGRHRMSWGLHDAELLIVPPDEESAQTIPNLANIDRLRGFAQQGFEPLPPSLRIAAEPKSGSSPEKDRAPLWCVTHDAQSSGASAAQWLIHIGETANPVANYQVLVPQTEIVGGLRQLSTRLESAEPVIPLAAPGLVPPSAVEEERTLAMSSHEAIAAAEEEEHTGDAGEADPWDFTEDTLSGDEATTARIRSTVGDVKHLAPALGAMANSAPSLDGAGSATAKPSAVPGAVKTPAATAAGAAMWEGVSSLPGEDGFAGGEDDPAFEFVSADTAPVPIQAPSAAGQKKEGR